MTHYRPTVAELCEYRQITATRVTAAVTAYLDDSVAVFPLSSAYTIDLAAAVRAHGFAAAIARDENMDIETRRAAVRAAILMACPQRRSAVR